jgi:hypothetical protein
LVEEMTDWQNRPPDQAWLYRWSRILTAGLRMRRYPWNKVPPKVKHRYFELIRSGRSGSDASQRVGVPLSCGSLWFIDASQVVFIDAPVSPRFLSDRLINRAGPGWASGVSFGSDAGCGPHDPDV